MPLQIRRGTEAERLVLASPPQSGELIWITDDQKLYIGDGATLLKDLSPITGFNQEDAADTIGQILGTDSTHAGISFNYNDAGGTIGTIDATVSLDQFRQNVNMNSFDLTGNGNINITGSVTATSFVGDYQGSISADDSTIMVDAVNGIINLNGTVGTDVIPNANEQFDLGSVTNRFKDLYLSGSTIYLGTSQISRNASGGVNLPANSTIDGGPIGGAGAGSSLNVDIVADDSTVLVNSSTGALQGTLTGDLNGSVFADDSTQLVNAIDGTVKLDNGTVEISDDQFLLTGSNELKLGATTDISSPSLVVTNTDGSPSFVSTVSGDASLGNISSSVLMRGIFGPDMTAPVAATAGDYIGQMTSRGYDPTTSSYITTSSVAFRLDPAKAVASDTYKGKIEFLNQNGTGSSPSLNYMTFDSDGQLAVNQQTASATLDVNGFAKLAVLTAAPASPANGMIAIADGTTWDPAGTGKSVMVVYLGGGWRTAATAP